MFAGFKDLLRVIEGNELALEHDGGAVSDAVHHIQVVGDQDVGQAQLGLQLAQQGQDFFGHQGVQGGRGFVQDDQLGLGRQGPGDAHALFLTARQLAGAALQKVFWQLHQAHQFFGPLQGLLPAQAKIELHWPTHDVQQTLAWVDGHIGDLVDQLDAPLEFLASLAEQMRQRLTLEHHFLTLGGQQARDDPGQGRLTRARLTHHRHGLAFFDVQRNPFDDVKRAVVGVAVLDGQHGLGLHGAGHCAFTRCGTANRHQPCGVVLLCVVQDLLGQPFLDFFAVAQHLDAVGHLGHHRQIVGDVERRRVVLADQGLEQDQHFDLGRHVQRSGGLVEHQHIGATRHRHRRHGALQLTTRDLVGVAIPKMLRVWQIQCREKFTRPGLGLGPVHDLVDQRRLADLVHQGVGRVEGRRRGLCNVGDAFAAHAPASVGIQAAQVDPTQVDFATRDVDTSTGIGHARQTDGGLTSTALTDQAEHLALVETQVDVVDDDVARDTLESQAFDVQDDVVVAHVWAPSFTVRLARQRGGHRPTTSNPPPS